MRKLRLPASNSFERDQITNKITKFMKSVYVVGLGTGAIPKVIIVFGEKKVGSFLRIDNCVTE